MIVKDLVSVERLIVVKLCYEAIKTKNIAHDLAAPQWDAADSLSTGINQKCMRSAMESWDTSLQTSAVQRYFYTEYDTGMETGV